ncbi:MAG: cell division protein ZapA [Pseudomonadota bacterium]
MSRSDNTVTVSILDKDYQVACPQEQQAELLLSAKHLDEQMRSIRAHGKVIGLERIAVMAALNISHELLQTRNGASPAKTSKAANPKAAAKEKPVVANDESPSESAPDERSLSGLNAKLDQALHKLRQLEIG